MRGVLRWFDAQVTRFVPARLRTADEARRARLLIGFCLCSIVPGCAFIALSLFNYRSPAIVVGAALATLTAALTPPLLRRTGSLALASAGLLAIITAIIPFSAASIEGLTSPGLAWLGVIPLLATMSAGRRAGILWSGICVLVVVALVVVDRAGVLQNRELPVTMRRAASAWNHALLIVVVLSFALLYESLRLQAMAALTRAGSELAATREQSIRGERLVSLGQMAAGVAHEINNPMTFISANVELLHHDLTAGPLTPDQQREYVTDVLPATDEGIRRVIAIVSDLRRFARGESESPVELDFNREVQMALRLCESQLLDCRLDVALGELPPMIGLPRQLTQVTMNLVINAAQAVARGGRIGVETEVDRGEIVLRIRDDGEGMTPEVQARIFEPFFTSRPVGEGMGLGLSVVHGIVQSHGGAILVSSQPGRGSVFEVRLPLPPTRGCVSEADRRRS